MWEPWLLPLWRRHLLYLDCISFSKLHWKEQISLYLTKWHCPHGTSSRSRPINQRTSQLINLNSACWLTATAPRMRQEVGDIKYGRLSNNEGEWKVWPRLFISWFSITGLVLWRCDWPLLPIVQKFICSKPDAGSSDHKISQTIYWNKK